MTGDAGLVRCRGRACRRRVNATGAPFGPPADAQYPTLTSRLLSSAAEAGDVLAMAADLPG